MKYRDGYKYQLAEDEVFLETPLRPMLEGALVDTDSIRLDPYGNLIVKAGYAWDGPSGPTRDDPTNMTPSLFHDAAYQLIRCEYVSAHYRLLADQHLGQLCIDRGMWKTRSWIWVRNLRRFGAPAADPKNKKIIHEVP
jgi:hypothetical protein